MRFPSFDRRIKLGLLALVIGQLCFWAGWGVLYDAALLYVVAVGVPYPAVLRSLVSRMVAAFVLVLSLVQIAGIMQFLAFPKSGFAVLSLLVTLLVAGVTWAVRNIPRQSIVLADKRDGAAALVAAFFAVPLLVLCFWGNDPARLTAFASVQGVDGANHYTMISEMNRVQHLNYQDAAYYPKGFHLASALMLHGVGANQQDQTWLANARIYILMFVAWGALLAYLVMMLVAQLREALPTRWRPPLFMLALGIGPVLALLYAVLFTQEGFLSYFYVVAAVVCGLLYVHDADKVRQWSLVAYLVCTFGIAATWGPLLAPALLAIPILYCLPHLTSVRRLVSPEWRWALLLFALQAVPIYVHLHYAHLSSQQGINATGGLKLFDYGAFIVDLALLVYVLCAPAVSESWRRFTGNVLLPFFVLVGTLMGFQYLTVGELRYYTIKTSLLLEILSLVLVALALGAGFMRAKLPVLQRWTAYALVMIVGMVVVGGLTMNPLDRTRILVGTLAHMPHHATPVRAYTALGMAGQLHNNTIELRFTPRGELTGNAVLTNWANLMQYTLDDTADMSGCSNRLFALQTSARPADEMFAAVKECAAIAANHHRVFIVVTDAASISKLHEQLGDTVAYRY